MKSSKMQNKVVEMKDKIYDVLESQKELFNTIMGNMNLFSTEKSKRKIGIAAIPLSLLFVDERYQGLRMHNNLRKLIENWDERKLGCIIVVPHPEEYRFAVVDGQGRLLAATELKYGALQSIILLDAPQDNKYERLKFEAEVFIGQDDETEDVRPLEKHPARVIIGDEAATILEEMFNKYDIRYTSSKGSREKSVLGSYPVTYEIAKRHGKSCLDFVFSIIKNAGWDNETNGYAVFVMEALKNIWTTFQNTEDRKNIYNYLSAWLRELDPTKLSSLARSKYLIRSDTRTCCRLYVEDVVCSNLNLKRPSLVA